MKTELVAFIKAVQEAARNGVEFRHQLTLGAHFDTDAAGILPSVKFGYGYYDPNKVLYTPPKESHPRGEGQAHPTPIEMEVEEAVDKFLAAYGVKYD